MIRRPPRSTLSSSSAASDVYKRQVYTFFLGRRKVVKRRRTVLAASTVHVLCTRQAHRGGSFVYFSQEYIMSSNAAGYLWHGCTLCTCVKCSNALQSSNARTALYQRRRFAVKRRRTTLAASTVHVLNIVKCQRGWTVYVRLSQASIMSSNAAGHCWLLVICRC